GWLALSSGKAQGVFREALSSSRWPMVDPSTPLVHVRASGSFNSSLSLPLWLTTTRPRVILPSMLTAMSAVKPGKFDQLTRAARASANSLVASESAFLTAEVDGFKSARADSAVAITTKNALVQRFMGRSSPGKRNPQCY